MMNSVVAQRQNPFSQVRCCVVNHSQLSEKPDASPRPERIARSSRSATAEIGP